MQVRTFVWIMIAATAILSSGAGFGATPDLGQTLAGIAKHEGRIRSVQYHVKASYPPCKELPRGPLGRLADQDVCWDSNHNIAFKGGLGGNMKQVKTERGWEFVRDPERKDDEVAFVWTSFDHNRCTDLNAARREVGINEGELDSNTIQSFAGQNYALTALGYGLAYQDGRLSLAGTLRKYGARRAGVPAEKIDGHETVALETTIPWGPGPDKGKPYYHVRVWVAPDLQFSPLRIEELDVKSNNSLKRRWAELRYARIDDIVFPVSFRALTFRFDPARKGEYVFPPLHVEITNVRLNKPLPDAMMKVEIPDGYTVIEKATGK